MVNDQWPLQSQRIMSGRKILMIHYFVDFEQPFACLYRLTSVASLLIIIIIIITALLSSLLMEFFIVK